MSKSNSWENDCLRYAFFGTTPAWAGNTNLYISLHSSDPGEAGDQTTNEIAYTGYARVAVVRTGTGWTVSGTAPTQSVNAGVVTFGECTVGSATASHVGIGAWTSGAGTLIYSGALSSSLAISVGITPSFQASALVVTEE